MRLYLMAKTAFSLTTVDLSRYQKQYESEKWDPQW